MAPMRGADPCPPPLLAGLVMAGGQAAPENPAEVEAGIEPYLRCGFTTACEGRAFQ